MTAPILYVGSQYLQSNGPTRRYQWRAGDDTSGNTASIFADCKPTMTLRDRPSVAVVRGTQELPDGTSVPLMAVVEDVDLTDYRGVSVEAVQSSGSMSLAEAYAAAYRKTIDADEIDVELTAAIQNYPYISPWSGPKVGSGANLAVSDPRYDLSMWLGRTRQETEDFNTRTFTASLMHYSSLSESLLPSTASAVQTAGDLAVSGADAYSMQFCRAVGQWSLRTGRTNTLEISDGTNWWQCENVAVVKTATRAILTGTIRGTPDHNTEGTKYAITRIRANGSILDLDPYRRPDLYIGQTLIVVADCARI